MVQPHAAPLHGLPDRLVMVEGDGPGNGVAQHGRRDRLELHAGGGLERQRGIVGIEVQIARIEGKAKLSQNRTEADRAGVIEGLRASGGVVEAQMAAQVEGANKP